MKLPALAGVARGCSNATGDAWSILRSTGRSLMLPRACCCKNCWTQPGWLAALSQEKAPPRAAVGLHTSGVSWGRHLGLFGDASRSDADDTTDCEDTNGSDDKGSAASSRFALPGSHMVAEIQRRTGGGVPGGAVAFGSALRARALPLGVAGSCLAPEIAAGDTTLLERWRGTRAPWDRAAGAGRASSCSGGPRCVSVSSSAATRPVDAWQPMGGPLVQQHGVTQW